MLIPPHLGDSGSVYHAKFLALFDRVNKISDKRAMALSILPENEEVSLGESATLPIPSVLSGMKLVAATAYVNTAGTTGANAIQICVSGNEVLTVTIPSGETESNKGTASYEVEEGDIIRILVTGVTAIKPAGLMLTLEFDNG